MESLHSSSNNPLPGVFSKVGEGIKDKGKSAELSLSKLGYRAVKTFYELTGNAQKVDQLKSKIDFLAKHKHAGKVNFEGRVIVKATNMPRLSVLSKPEKYTELDKNLTGQIAPEKKGEFGSPAIDDGVCWGACIDFARRLNSVGTENNQEFLKNIRSVAKKFKYGAGKKGVALQMLQITKFKKEESQMEQVLDYLSRNTNLKNDSYDAKDFPNFPYSDLIKDIYFRLKAERYNQIVNKSLDPEMSFHPEEFNNIVIRELADKGQEKLLPLFKNLIQSFIETTTFERNTNAPPAPRSEHLDKSEIVELYGMEFKKECEVSIKILKGEAKLEAYEDIFKNTHFEDGSHLCSFYTGENSSHAILFIKKGDESFLWDPNLGLISTDNNPGQALHSLMKTYNVDVYFGDTARQDNHSIESANILDFYSLEGGKT